MLTDQDRASLADRIDAALPQTQCTRCGQGGATGIAMLAAITGRPEVALDPAHGSEGPLRLARIDESRCIGCALCREACPAWCTGCELCLPPCPVDCIEMIPAGREWQPTDATAARSRFLGRRAGASTAAPTPPPGPPPGPPDDAQAERRRAAAAAALARARARRAAIEGKPR